MPNSNNSIVSFSPDTSASLHQVELVAVRQEPVKKQESMELIYTPQQIAGYKGYYHAVRIGNWSEEMELQVKCSCHDEPPFAYIFYFVSITCIFYFLSITWPFCHSRIVMS